MGNHHNNSVVTKTVSSRAALVARAAKVEKVDTTVALVDTTVALVAMAAREGKVAREDTTVVSHNVLSFAKVTAAGTTCTGTIKIMPSGTDVTRTLGTREDTLVEVASVVVITPVGVTTITSTIRCRPTNPRKTTTSTIRCRPTNPPSVIRPSIVTTTIAAIRNKTATKSVNGSVVVSAARAAKEDLVPTTVPAVTVATVAMVTMASIAVIYKVTVVREVSVVRVERVDTTAAVVTKSVTLCVNPSTKHLCRTTDRSFVPLWSRRASILLV